MLFPYVDFLLMKFSHPWGSSELGLARLCWAQQQADSVWRELGDRSLSFRSDRDY